MREIFGYRFNNPALLEEEYQKTLAEEGKERAVADFIAGMSDTYAISMYEQIFVPKSWS